MDTTEQLLKLVQTPLKIRGGLSNGHVLHTFEILHQKCFNWGKNPHNLQTGDYMFEIDSILDYLHEELNTGKQSSGQVRELPANNSRPLEHHSCGNSAKLYHSNLPQVPSAPTAPL